MSLRPLRAVEGYQAGAASMKEGPYIPHLFGEQLHDLYRAHRRWLTCAVEHSIAWPERDVLVQYDGQDYFLRGLRDSQDKPSPACISVRLRGDEVNADLSKVYKFSSILGWFKGGYVNVVGYISGTHPILYASGNPRFAPVMQGGPNGFDCNFMPLVRDERIRKALAFWREGLSLEHVNAGYAFLSFYKVIESQFKKGRAKGNWINLQIPELTGRAKERVDQLRAEEVDVGRHIFQSGRCAVAHSTLGEELVDPDIPEDRIRIERDLVVVRALAQKYIRQELGVPNEMEVYETRDALQPLYEYLDPNQRAKLRAGDSVPRKRLGLNNLKVSVNRWPHKAPVPLTNLTLKVISAHDGLASVQATNDANNLSLAFLLDFPKKKAGPDLDSSSCVPIERGGTPESVIAFLEYQKAVLGNGIIEILFPNGQKAVCEIVIPVNVDIGATFNAINKQIESAKGNSASAEPMAPICD